MKYLTSLIFLILIITAVYPQKLEILESHNTINTFGKLKIVYIIKFNSSIDTAKTAQSVRSNEYCLREINTNLPVNGVTVKKAIGDSTLTFSVIFDDNANSEIIERVFSKSVPTYISVSGDISVYPNNNYDACILSAGMLQQLTVSSDKLTEGQKKMLINNLNGTPLEIKNNLDFSKEVNNEDSTKSEYALAFDISNPVFYNVYGSSIYYQLKGRVSTNNFSSHNNIELFLKYKLYQFLVIEAGRSGPQKLNKNAIRVNASYETLLPNFIDLTGGTPRFRLKPYINFGLAFQQNFYVENQFKNKKGNFIAFAEGYYYIPVWDEFTVIAEGHISYSDNFITDDKLVSGYSMSFGYETPLNNLKVLFKVLDGKTEINLGEGTVYSVGLLMDFMSF